MLWVDHQTYFGPDRRIAAAGLRLRERRRMNCAGNPPPLTTALRQLRVRAIDARGPGVGPFVDRTQNTAVLADWQNEHEAAHLLSSLSIRLSRGVAEDLRPSIYCELDRVHGALVH